MQSLLLPTGSCLDARMELRSQRGALGHCAPRPLGLVTQLIEVRVCQTRPSPAQRLKVRGLPSQSRVCVLRSPLHSMIPLKGGSEEVRQPTPSWKTCFLRLTNCCCPTIPAAQLWCLVQPCPKWKVQWQPPSEVGTVLRPGARPPPSPHSLVAAQENLPEPPGLASRGSALQGLPPLGCIPGVEVGQALGPPCPVF